MPLPSHDVRRESLSREEDNPLTVFSIRTLIGCSPTYDKRTDTKRMINKKKKKNIGL